MSTRSFTHQGVRQVAIDHLGGGSVTIEPNAGDDVVEGSIETNDEQHLELVDVRMSTTGLRLSFPRELHREAALHLRLRVADGLEYAIIVGSADVTARAAIGRSKITSGSGDIYLGHANDLDCSTGSGNIFVETAAGRSARLVSGSGDIAVDEAHCPVSAKSGSGEVTVNRAHHHHVQAKSGSGDIAVNRTGGSLDLRTASGSVAVGIADGMAAWLDLDSGTGEIRISLDSTAQPPPHEPYASVRARTASGDITVQCADTR